MVGSDERIAATVRRYIMGNDIVYRIYDPLTDEFYAEYSRSFFLTKSEAMSAIRWSLRSNAEHFEVRAYELVPLEGEDNANRKEVRN